ncbi:dihydrofolate reductase [Roseivirga sp.]|jgi:dihydrofolate reductase|uniref:dihydrofolate reductase n=1 Tax=Roseivirga sp. TaxID=1964215 RepID=UPI0023530472|nr:dihydrofolate reductase [Roseivirga sp.]
MIKTIVVAKSKNNAIGKDNDLLWRLPDDFRFFKQVTLDHAVILGRKTFDSLPGLLPKRTFIIVTRQEDYQAPEGHFAVNSLEAAFELAQDELKVEEVFVIGGGVIYKESLDKGLVDKMHITEVNAIIDEADTFFPEFDHKNWKEETRVHHPADEKHQYAFDFVTYLKK